MQPFIALAQTMQEYGHRVRLATHGVYRDFVEEHDLEFFPLGGNPQVLLCHMYVCLAGYARLMGASGHADDLGAAL